MEIAKAIAYLHRGFTRPMFDFELFMSIPEGKTGIPDEVTGTYRFVTPEYVMTSKFNGKLDVYPQLPRFLISCICAICQFLEGETHVEEMTSYIIGPLGSFVPDYFSSPRFNEKVDVYSFGALLLELLTGCRMIDTLEVESSLEDDVKNCIEQSRFTEMVHPIIVGIELSPKKEQLLLAFTELALSCLSLSEEDKPTMIDVAKQLRQMYISACQLMPKLCL
ncbi:hypothetical protein Pint_19838 [Pistacia integerrima]|uniref:Uncharacterized protein n=1 Tax=Pistacia integerrima TaxID=434235 RepID=A0ACC0XAR2_9ROSI|nr:hypothetical protein Pint_19838 [Pistacia integerrima]